MAIEKLFILAGMPAAGKSSLGNLATPPANWPFEDFWQQSMMACDLQNKKMAELPSNLAVEIDFSHTGTDGRPGFGPKQSPLADQHIEQLAPQSTTVVTLWAPAPVLLKRFVARSVVHRKEQEVQALYANPPRLNEFYRAWLACVDAFPTTAIGFSTQRPASFCLQISCDP